MKTPILLKTIRNFRKHLELLIEDLEFEKEGRTLAFYFDTEYLQRAALGYKDYYFDDDLEHFKVDEFNDDTTLVCSLVSGGFIGQFRLLPPHQNEFLNKINSDFDGTNYARWRDEVHTFVSDAEFDLNVDEFARQLETESDENLIKKFTEHTEATKRGFNISHCLLPWDRRLTSWERKKILVVENEYPDYDAIFVSKHFNVLKATMGKHRKHDVSNFIDATALAILIELTRKFKNKTSQIVPRFFIPATKYNLFRTALTDTGLVSELTYSLDNRESTVLRNEEYFFYRSVFRRQSRNNKSLPTVEWGETEIKELYEKTTTILENIDTLETLVFEDHPLQEIIEGMENYSFLKNVWIEFINSGDLKNILFNLDDIKKQFDEAKKSYDDVSFAEQVKNALKTSRKNIFENLDVVKKASLLWEGINKKVVELREGGSKESVDGDALFRDRRLFRYGFPEEFHKEIKEQLVLLLSGEIEARLTEKVIGKLVNVYRKAERADDDGDQRHVILITAILCALGLPDKIKKLLDRSKKNLNLHYSLKIALAGAELDSNNYQKGKCLIEELEKLYYKDNTPAAVQCDLAIGLTYLYYYAWLALRRMMERDRAISEDPKTSKEVTRLINNAIVFAERASSLVSSRPLAQRVYVYNQYLFCLVESENPENNKKMRNAAPNLMRYQGEEDVWSYMYSDTLSHYFRWRASEQSDRNQKEVFRKKALSFSQKAMAMAPNDVEISAYHTKLIDEFDLGDR